MDQDAAPDGLRFSFDQLYPQIDGLSDDLEWLLHLVAARFVVSIAGETLYEESDFPVLEFAHVVDKWLATDMPAGGDLSYEVSGAETGVISFRRVGSGWSVEVADGFAGAPGSRVLEAQEIQEGFNEFVDSLARAARRDFGLNVPSLLRRRRAA